MSVWRWNDRWRHNWQDLVADGMWRLMENEVSGMTTKFPAWEAECLKGATHHENEYKRRGMMTNKFYMCESLSSCNSRVKTSYWQTSQGEELYKRDEWRNTMSTWILCNPPIAYFLRSIPEIFSNVAGVHKITHIFLDHKHTKICGEKYQVKRIWIS